ncbi:MULTISPECIES: glycosyltransferase family 4 protein [Pseudoalteromonas]|uniref:glycosyltransferase family 4 protein n=1 Tax=Pseudoalteromonas TaxID=53246 RepID=UPI0006D67FF4|nr:MULTISPECIES: glycosyltransferase family 4 protein [Pseudoalteromonas]KPZ72083.1 GalNAc-alpha-(1->4)-GalNAc-alpha-(1->3)-diNAcBac-PP-UDP alpha-1,4-N-acetyl-D-galactosaminyltransferase [Pseudoalteromonas sp. P1-26]MCG9734630.1 glycosyltransferase family 4 protein [Pseudoalteromonas shioyasakiensis]MDK9683660.1 glycosyltransferase family 4 protein [Pseudoalteromonas shioyasakiensis]
MKYSVILFVDSSLIGGIESHLIAMSKLLERYNIMSSVLFYQDHNNRELYNRLENANITFGFAGGNLKSLNEILKMFPRSALLHTHGYKASIMGKLVCRWQNRPCISTYHAGEAGTGKVYFYNKLDKLLSYFSLNFAVSSKLTEELYNAELLENFIQVNESTKVLGLKHNNELNVGFVGRLSHEKGPDIFIETAKRFNTANLKFHMFGDGPMLNELDMSAVSYHGQCEQQQIWQQLDVLVICSRAEGLPMVALEAMAHGVLVIASPVGQLPQIINHLSNGLMMTESTSDALHKQLNNVIMLSNDQRSYMLGNAQRLVKQRFSGEQQFKQLDRVYSSSLLASLPSF